MSARPEAVETPQQQTLPGLELSGQHTRVPIELLDSDLSWRARLAYVALASFASNTGLAWPSMSKIAERMGVSERTARDGVNELREGIWVNEPDDERRGIVDGEHSTSGRSNIYVVELPPIKGSAGDAEGVGRRCRGGSAGDADITRPIDPDVELDAEQPPSAATKPKCQEPDCDHNVGITDQGTPFTLCRSCQTALNTENGKPPATDEQREYMRTQGVKARQDRSQRRCSRRCRLRCAGRSRSGACRSLSRRRTAAATDRREGVSRSGTGSAPVTERTSSPILRWTRDETGHCPTCREKLHSEACSVCAEKHLYMRFGDRWPPAAASPWRRDCTRDTRLASNGPAFSSKRIAPNARIRNAGVNDEALSTTPMGTARRRFAVCALPQAADCCRRRPQTRKRSRSHHEPRMASCANRPSASHSVPATGGMT